MSKPTDPAVAAVVLHVETVGAGERVVLTHGLGDTAATWDRVRAPLAVAHQVTAWDLRGHGQSEASDDPHLYSRDIAVDDLLRVIGEPTEPVTLIGHSLGGYLSLAVALRHPDLVAALVMISSGPGFRDAAARAAWNHYVDRAATRMPIADVASRLCHQPDSWVIDALPSLRCPLLQIVGGDDERFHDGVAYVQRVVSHGSVVIIPGAGHHPQLTHSADVLAAIADVVDVVD